MVSRSRALGPLAAGHLSEPPAIGALVDTMVFSVCLPATSFQKIVIVIPFSGQLFHGHLGWANGSMGWVTHSGLVELRCRPGSGGVPASVACLVMTRQGWR